MPALTPGKTPATLATSAQIGTGSLVFAGSGTAMASVCVVGLFLIERSVGGVWAVLAIALAAAVCFFLAYVFSHLSSVLPSGAGLLTFISRAFNKPTGAAIVIPYLLLMMFLVGFESLIVGGMLERLTGTPTLSGAILFIVTTWAICRVGMRVGYRAQNWTTIALFVSLVGVSLILVAGSARRGDLLIHLFPGIPSFGAFFNAVGQALFLFLGFELITSHVEVARPGAVRKALPISVLVLLVFYATVSLGFSAAALRFSGSPGELYVPQIAVAELAGGVPAIAAVTLICILASFTSLNGALLALSRLLYALAALGLLPRQLATLDRKMVAGPALTTLVFGAIGSTITVYTLGLQQASILAAAVTAAFVYCASTLARERPPFRQSPQPQSRRLAWALAVGLAALGVGVIVQAGRERPTLLAVLAVSYGLAALAAWRLTHTARRIPPRQYRGAVSSQQTDGTP